MKAFFVGLIFLCAVFVLAAAGILLFPLLIVLAWFLRAIAMLVFILAGIWLLGKFIIYVWGKIKD